MFKNLMNKFNRDNSSDSFIEKHKLIELYQKLLLKIEESGSSFDTELVDIESFKKMIHNYDLKKIDALYDSFQSMIEIMDNIKEGDLNITSYREHHYLFAYKIMPKLFFLADSFQVFIDTAIRKGDTLKTIWDYSFTKVEDKLNSKYIEADGLKAEHIDNDKVTGLLITLPEAKIEPEAKAILLLVSKDDSDIGRYYTLELSSSPFSEEESTMFCETVIANRSEKSIEFNRVNSGSIEESKFLQMAMDKHFEID